MIFYYQRNRRVDSDRWAESYGKEFSYYYNADNVNKVGYLYLDAFESQKVVLKDGTSPKHGEYVKGGMFSAKQIDWLVETLKNIPNEYSVVVNMHLTPNSDIFGTLPAVNNDNWWEANVNPNLVAGVLLAFQNSKSFSGSSDFNEEYLSKYNMDAYKTSVDIDFSGRTKKRIAVINYGHWYTYGHTEKTENGNFNIVQHPNFLGPGWSYIGDTRGTEFTTEIIDTVSRTIKVVRYSPLDTCSDKSFTLSY